MMSALMSHFIVVAYDVLQIFECHVQKQMQMKSLRWGAKIDVEKSNTSRLVY